MKDMPRAAFQAQPESRHVGWRDIFRERGVCMHMQLSRRQGDGGVDALRPESGSNGDSGLVDMWKSRVVAVGETRQRVFRRTK